MRFRDKIGPLHDPILKPAILPDFLAVARIIPKEAEKSAVFRVWYWPERARKMFFWSPDRDRGHDIERAKSDAKI